MLYFYQRKVKRKYFRKPLRAETLKIHYRNIISTKSDDVLQQGKVVSIVER